MIKAIVIPGSVAWYCEKCNIPHNVLYIDGKKHYCQSCVPESIKNAAKYFNQNREEIEEEKEI